MNLGIAVIRRFRKIEVLIDENHLAGLTISNTIIACKVNLSICYFNHYVGQIYRSEIYKLECVNCCNLKELDRVVTEMLALATISK